MRQSPKNLHRQRSRVDAQAAKAQHSLEGASPPSRGWVKGIRESLGMSAQELGARLGISKQAVLKLEEGEQRKSASLRSLERAAEAMQCRLLYAIVPVQSLDAQLDERARLVARRRLERAVPSSPDEGQVNALANELKAKLGAELWKDA